MSSPKKMAWQNPKDIMKAHQIKRRSSDTKAGLNRSKSVPGPASRNRRQGFSQDESSKQSLPTSQPLMEKSSVELQKRKNPFMREVSSLQPPVKRRSLLTASDFSTGPEKNEVEEHETCGETMGSAADGRSCIGQPKLLSVLKQADLMAADVEPENDRDTTVAATKVSHGKEGATSLSSKISSEKKSSTRNAAEKESEHSDENYEECPPTDWSLKTKMRVVVEMREESFRRLPGIDAKNVTNFVHHTLQHAEDWSSLDLYQRLRRCCLHYSYPHVPWLRTFPRLTRDFRSKSTSLFSNSEDVLKALQSDWTTAFTSLYQQLRGGICPYFYVCIHQFTVLFRCQRFTSQHASISALLSPSTRGLRELLTKEDIEFRLPNVDMHKVKSANQNNEQQSDSCGKEIGRTQPVQGTECWEERDGEDVDILDGTDEDDINDDDGASKWLEGMGLNKKDFPTLEPLKVKLQRDGYREIDNRPQSMVYIEGGDVHTFFNFLVNYPACIAISGPQHGLPPTLLSPAPFVGGTLVQNSVKHSSLRETAVKQAGGQEFTYSHVFEISGPILPHHSLNIAAILQSNCEALDSSHDTTSPASVMTFNTEVSTAALNTQAVNKPEKDQLAVNWNKLFVNFDPSSQGLLPHVRDGLVKAPSLQCGGYLRELKVSAQGFVWS